MQGVHPEVHLREAEEYSYSTGVLLIVQLDSRCIIGSLWECIAWS